MKASPSPPLPSFLLLAQRRAKKPSSLLRRYKTWGQKTEEEQKGKFHVPYFFCGRTFNSKWVWVGLAGGGHRALTIRRRCSTCMYFSFGTVQSLEIIAQAKKIEAEGHYFPSPFCLVLKGKLSLKVAQRKRCVPGLEGSAF